MLAIVLFAIQALVSFQVISAASTLTGKVLETYSFEQYLKDFNLSYSDSSEYQKRKAIFESELSRVVRLNAGKAGWVEGINQYSVLSKEEKKAFFGRVKMSQKTRLSAAKNTQSLPKDFKLRPVSELPANVDWRSEGVVTSVKDQGHCGSCWAFASTATIESHVAINSGLLFDLSVQQMAMCAPNPDQCGGVGKCEGSTAELAFEYVTGSKGLLQEFQYPYVSYYGTDYACGAPGASRPVATVNGYVHLPDNNYTTLMNAIATVGPISINVDASTWHAYAGGVFNGCNQDSPDVNHVVVLVGYGVDSNTGAKYWLVRNSWSPAWGEKGYIRLARFDNDDERCGTDTTPQDGVACADAADTPVKVCGTCGAIYDSSYPLNAVAL